MTILAIQVLVKKFIVIEDILGHKEQVYFAFEIRTTSFILWK